MAASTPVRSLPALQWNIAGSASGSASAAIAPPIAGAPERAMRRYVLPTFTASVHSRSSTSSGSTSVIGR